MFSNSILPTESGYYELNKASIQSGIMILQAGGSAKYTVSTRVLPMLTENFRVSILPVTAVDGYIPKLHVYVSATTVDGNHYNYTMTPSESQGLVCTDIIEFEAAEYTEFTFMVHAIEATRLQLWELCPESSDANTEVIIDGVKQSLPRLLFDYNLAPITIGQDMDTIGMIAFNLKDQTDLQGHLSISYVALEDCVLTLRVLDNSVTELYAPIVYDIKEGRGNITLPHAYLDRLAGNHATVITAQVSNGTVVIYTRGLLYTIDGGYLAERETDVGLNLFDFSVKQPEGSSGPTELWIVGVDAGEALVRSREYNADVSASFTARYSLGFAKDVAIEFDGKFMLRDEKHTLYTDDEPYVFFIDTDDVLWCQLGSDEETKYQLDTNVSSVSACRGYKSNLQLEYDQGLIVLYVKNGQATYRNYCSDAEGNVSWHGPFVVSIEDDEEVLSASVHRLNDYRVGFAINTATRNLWLISDRTYVNQSVKPETLSTGYTASYPLVAISEPGYVIEQPVVTARMTDAKTILLTFSTDIGAIDTLNADYFTSTASSVATAEIVDSKTLKIILYDEALLGTIISYKVPDGNLRFTYDNWNRAFALQTFTCYVPGTVYKETLSTGYSTATAQVSLRGIETSNVVIPSDTLSTSYEEASASITLYGVTTSRHDMPADTLSTSYSSASVDVAITQVGTKPI